MACPRSTLAQIPGSVLHDMFSCQESDRFLPRSSRGEIFLDFEPYMFALVSKALPNRLTARNERLKSPCKLVNIIS